MEIVNVKISELKSAEYNPRQMTEKQVLDLTESIKQFGLVDPIIVNNNENRRNVVIGGHQRLKIALQLGFDSVPVVYLDLDENREKELNIRLNKNLGEWNWDLLRSFDTEFLKSLGFEDEELLVNFGLSDANKQDLDLERLNVLTVNPPEAPSLKERVEIKFTDIEEYKKVKQAINEGKISQEKLLELC